MLQTIVHYSLHLLLPGLIAYLFFRNNWKWAWFLMILTMFIDLDHLLANPIFDPNRCSIGFHPLHSTLAVGFYAFLTFFKKSRIIGFGLLLHIAADYVDCLWMR